MYRSEGHDMESIPPFRFVKGSLKVDFLKPETIEGAFEIRSIVREIKGRKVVIDTTVMAPGVITARCKVETHHQKGDDVNQRTATN